MEALRTFISFETPPAVRNELNAFQSRLKETDIDVKWESQEKFHVTITFLGEVQISTIDSLIERIRQTVTLYSKFDIIYTSFGCFPNKQHPQVVWVGCENTDGKLLRLKTAIDKELYSFGFEVDRKPFRPHVTLGRVKSGRGLPHLLSILENLTFEPRVATIGEIAVMKSELHPQGAKHSILQLIQLSP